MSDLAQKFVYKKQLFRHPISGLKQLFTQLPISAFFWVFFMALVLFSWQMLERIQHYGRVARIEIKIASQAQQIAALKQSYIEQRAEWETLSSPESVKILVQEHLPDLQPMPFSYQAFYLPPRNTEEE